MKNWSTVDKDQGFDKIVQNLISLSNEDVSVGFHDDGTMSDDGEMSMVDLAMQNQKGSNDGHIPSRPFMDETAIKYETQIAGVQTAVVGKVIDGKLSPKVGVTKTGEAYKGMMKSTIDQFSTPANAESTISHKRSGNFVDNPLVDTGKMRDSITVKVGGA